jgi:hypothetical protein
MDITGVYGTPSPGSTPGMPTKIRGAISTAVCKTVGTKESRVDAVLFDSGVPHQYNNEKD